MFFNKLSCFIYSFLLLSALFIAQGQHSYAAQGTTPAGIKPQQRPLPRVVYGFDREFPPFSYEDPGGKPVGFEVELLESVLKGRANLLMRPLTWDILPLELSEGAINVTSGLVKTEQRAKNYGFSARPSFELQVRFFTKIYSRVPNNTLLRGQTVSVDESSYQHRLLESFGGVNIKPHPPKTAGLRALYNDEVAAYCGLDQTTYYYINKLNYGAITTIGEPIGKVEMHFAVNRDRGDILRIINDGMKEVLESGEYNRIYRKWFVKDLSEAEINAMIGSANSATITSYAPYGKIRTGAAILTATGQTYNGCNIENADAKLSISALEAALAKAISAGEMEFRAFVIMNADGSIVQPDSEDAQLLYQFGKGTLAVQKTQEGLFDTPMLADILLVPIAEKSGRSVNID